MQKAIIETPGEPYMVGDTWTPVFETTKYKSTTKTRLWLSLHEATSVTGEDPHDIYASAKSKQPTKSGLQFQFPSRAMLTAYLPEHPVIRKYHGQPAIPVTATFSKGTGKNKITEPIHYGSISQFCTCNALSWSRGNKLITRQPGWKRLLPGCMINVQRHSSGWTPPGGWPNNPGQSQTTPLFEITARGGYLHVKYTNITRAKLFSELPALVVANAQ